MLGRLFLLLIAWTFLEFTVLARVHSYWASLWGSSEAWLLSLGSLVLAALIGVNLAKRQGFKLAREAQEQLRSGRVPDKQILDGFLIFLASALLFAPGYLSDGVGLLLLVPWTRSLVRGRVRGIFDRKMREGTFKVYRSSSSATQHEKPRSEISAYGEIIDIEAEPER